MKVDPFLVIRNNIIIIRIEYFIDSLMVLLIEFDRSEINRRLLRQAMKFKSILIVL